MQRNECSALITEAKRIVVKVGTSTLTYSNGQEESASNRGIGAATDGFIQSRQGSSFGLLRRDCRRDGTLKVGGKAQGCPRQAGLGGCGARGTAAFIRKNVC